MAEEARPGRPPEVLRHPAFAAFWVAFTVRAFGGAVSGVAVQVVVVRVLDATPAQIGLLNALGVAPYLVLGLIVGALMDRRRRQRALVMTTAGQAVVLAVIPVLLLLGVLDLPVLAVLLLIQGALAVFMHSAEQPLLPNLVPRRLLVAANARLGQSGTVAATAGPAIGGALVSLLGPPLLFVVDAAVTAVAALLQSRIRVEETVQRSSGALRTMRADVVEGLRYTYGHRTLRPLALSVHLWFLGNSVVATAFAVFVLRDLRVSAIAYGIAIAAGGVGGFVGALMAPRLGGRMHAGGAILLGRALSALAWAPLALLPLGASGGPGLLLPVLAAVQFVFALGTGVEDANDTAYRQSVAPDELQGRMNSSIRTANRAVFFVGAILAGVLLGLVGSRVVFGVATSLFTAAALVVLLSPLRNARHTA